jgi:DNA polymerase-3 subunit alpha
MIEDIKFKSQFKSYSESYSIDGVRIPSVDIDEAYKRKYGLDTSMPDSDILRQICLIGYKNRGIDLLPNKQEYIDRVKFELSTLERLGFTRYMLMVWDLIEWCDERKIARGWGRGSVGGSLIAYLSGLVAVDPIEHGLIFERFINESRAKSKMINGEQYSDGSTVPDIDIDVSYLHRDRVVKEYLESKYPNRTCHISTMNTLSTKLVLKEVCKKYAMYDESKANRISSMIGSDAGTLDSLEKTIENNNDFREWAEANQDIFNICRKLINLPRNFGVHAAGIVVSYDEVFDSLPLETRKDNEGKEKIITSYCKDDVAEKEIKLDCLGLKTVDIIYNTAKEVGYDISKFDPEDPEIYKFLCSFDYTYGIFQLDGDTASRVTRRVKPKCLSDVSAISAIARPGALAFLDKFVEARETGNQESIYPSIDEILKETSGAILYQEQIMAIANKVYGFSLLEADVLRKIIGKKKVKAVREWENKIYEAGERHKIPREATEIFWNTVQASAKYSFNKSHSVAYSYISTLCSYLKITYPAEFFKNCLMLARTFQNSEARILQISKEAPHFGVEIKPPDLIESSEDFTVKGNVIRYGLKSIKSVSNKSIEKLKDFNPSDMNKFKMFEFAKESGINITILCNIIKAGCLSSFSNNRGKLFLEAKTWNLLSEAQKLKLYKYGSKYNFDLLKLLLDVKNGDLLYDGKEIFSTNKRQNKNGEMVSTWDTFYGKYLNIKEEYIKYSKNPNFYNYFYEVDILGFAYSMNLTKVIEDLYPDAINISEVEDLPTDSKIVSCGIVQEVRMSKTKKGGSMINIDIADEHGRFNLKAFNFEYFDSSSRQRVSVNNVDEIKATHGRYPVKKDIVVFRGTKKDRCAFVDKLKILNLEL